MNTIRFFSLKEERPFEVMVKKEVADHIRSRRFLVMLLLVLLVFAGTLYASFSQIRAARGTSDFVFLKLLTLSGGALPPFHVFMSFLGPLLGIALGFDAINSEHNNRTLVRLLAQPVYRDNLLLAKFCGALLVIGVLFLSLVLLMTGGGILLTGVKPEPAEMIRILAFTALNVVYVGFWLSLAITLSVTFRNVATSALTAIGIWLFFTVFYPILVNAVVGALAPSGYLTPDQLLNYNRLLVSLLRLDPGQLYTDASTTLLMPSVRSLGALSTEQMAGAVPSPLAVTDSLMIVWPQVTGLLAGTLLCFALAYALFMRKEVRA